MSQKSSLPQPDKSDSIVLIPDIGDMESDERAAPMVWRHPYLDLRVLTFMLSVPPVPWAWEKQLLRETMQGYLPPEILARRKTPVSVSPLMTPLHENDLPALANTASLARFVDLGRARSSDEVLEDMLPLHTLDHWLTATSRRGL